MKEKVLEKIKTKRKCVITQTVLLLHLTVYKYDFPKYLTISITMEKKNIYILNFLSKLF